MLNNAIYPVVPTGGSDPNVGNWVEGGVGIEVDATLATAGVTITFSCDGQCELDWYKPDGTWQHGNATSSVNSGTPPYTPTVTWTVGQSNGQTTFTEGWNQLRFRVNNTAAPNGDNSWDNNPSGIAFTAVRNDTGALIFTSRGDCTGGVTTTTAPGTGGGAGGSGGTIEIPTALANDSRFTITQTVGADGTNGGYIGNGSNDASGGIGFGGGGDGTAQIKQSSIAQAAVTYTSNGSWTIPTPSGTEISRNITVTVLSLIHI